MQDKYAKTFKEVIAEASSLNFSNLGLECDLHELGPTLELCKDRLLSLNLSNNMNLTGTLEVLSICEKLEALKLEECHQLTG